MTAKTKNNNVEIFVFSLASSLFIMVIILFSTFQNSDKVEEGQPTEANYLESVFEEDRKPAEENKKTKREIITTESASQKQEVVNIDQQISANKQIEETTVQTTSQETRDDYPIDQVKIAYQPTEITPEITESSAPSETVTTFDYEPVAELKGFVSSSIPNGSTGIETTQSFTVDFGFPVTENFAKRLQFIPAADFSYQIDGNNLTIYPERLQRLTNYQFGMKSTPMCLMNTNPQCSSEMINFTYSLEFQTSWKEQYIYGQSVEGRALVSYIYGKSDESGTKIMLTGAIHGEEWRSGDLTRLRQWMDDKPYLLEGQNKSVIIVPLINIDGATKNQRYNANGVNLNRQFPAYWEPGDNRGPYPLSEPETASLADFTIEEAPDYLISYHAQWPPYGMIFLGDNGNSETMSFARWVANKTGYPVGIFNDGDHVPGDQTEWAETIGIRSLIIEATYRENTDWTKNFPLYQALLNSSFGSTD